MIVSLTHSSGIRKYAKIGFSWTIFFFGAFVPLLRGDFKWMTVMACLSLVFGSLTFGIGVAVVGLIFSFIYNKIYIKELLEKGYVADEMYSREVNYYVNNIR